VTLVVESFWLSSRGSSSSSSISCTRNPFPASRQTEISIRCNVQRRNGLPFIVFCFLVGAGSSELDSEARLAGAGRLLWIGASESSRSSVTVAVREPGEDGGATGFEFCDG